MQNLIQLDVSIPKLDNEGYKFYQKAMNHRLEKAVDWLDFVSKKTALRGCSYIVYSTSSEFSSKLELIESIIGNNNFYVFMTKDKNIIKLNVFSHDIIFIFLGSLILSKKFSMERSAFSFVMTMSHFCKNRCP